jgi:hypothetical protein
MITLTKLNWHDDFLFAFPKEVLLLNYAFTYPSSTFLMNHLMCHLILPKSLKGTTLSLLHQGHDFVKFKSVG